MSLEYDFYKPQPYEAAPYADFRKATFIEQALTVGVEETAIEEHVRDWGSEHSDDVQRWADLFTSGLQGEKYVRGVRADGEVAGIFIGHCESTLPECQGDGYIELIQLGEHCRGHGNGTMLMGSFLRQISRPAWLHVYDGNKRAQRFYTDLAFKEQTRVVQKIGYQDVVAILMKRELQQGERS